MWTTVRKSPIYFELKSITTVPRFIPWVYADLCINLSQFYVIVFQTATDFCRVLLYHIFFVPLLMTNFGLLQTRLTRTEIVILISNKIRLGSPYLPASEDERLKTQVQLH